MAQTSSIREIIDRNGIMVIDGSMSTALENLGANLNSKLWTAKALEVSPGQARTAGSPAVTRRPSPGL